MPVKPENKARYPANWGEIRAAILERSGMRCEHPGCRASQYAVGHWHREAAGLFSWSPCVEGAASYSAARTMAAEFFFAQGEEGPKPTVIVLTIAHLNHQPEDCRPENLAALCQRHHLAHDHQHHQANAQATRRARAGTAELFA